MRKPNVSILIVEDDEDLRLLISEALLEKGYSVIEAENGKKAIQMLNKVSPSLILMDLEMPVMSGKELITMLNEDDQLKQEWGKIPLVIYSASIDSYPELVPFAKASLHKPLDLEELVSTIESIISTNSK